MLKDTIARRIVAPRHIKVPGVAPRNRIAMASDGRARVRGARRIVLIARCSVQVGYQGQGTVEELIPSMTGCQTSGDGKRFLSLSVAEAMNLLLQAGLYLFGQF